MHLTRPIHQAAPQGDPLLASTPKLLVDLEALMSPVSHHGLITTAQIWPVTRYLTCVPTVQSSLQDAYVALRISSSACTPTLCCLSVLMHVCL